jgi:hypothetical protein
MEADGSIKYPTGRPQDFRFFTRLSHQGRLLGVRDRKLLKIQEVQVKGRAAASTKSVLYGEATD